MGHLLGRGGQLFCLAAGGKDREALHTPGASSACQEPLGSAALRALGEAGAELPVINPQNHYLSAPPPLKSEVSQSKTVFSPQNTSPKSQGRPPAAPLRAPFLGAAPMWAVGGQIRPRGHEAGGEHLWTGQTRPCQRPCCHREQPRRPWSCSHSRLMLAALLCSSLSFFSSSAAFLSSSACCCSSPACAAAATA